MRSLFVAFVVGTVQSKYNGLYGVHRYELCYKHG